MFTIKIQKIVQVEIMTILKPSIITKICKLGLSILCLKKS